MGLTLVAMEQRADPLADTKAKVHEWARWFRDRRHLGYPPHSWEGRAIFRGGSAPRPGDAAHGLPTNEIAEQVEAAMQLMDNYLRHALVERHVNRRLDKDAAKKCHCSLSGFKERCTRAYFWLDGRLGS